MTKARLSIVIGLLFNMWTIYAAVYLALSDFGADKDITLSVAFLSALAALIEPILTYFCRGHI